jgi:rhomboid protease GluP
MPAPPAAAEPPDTGLHSPLEFAPTRRRQSLVLAAMLLGFGLLIMTSVDALVEPFGLGWRLLAACAVAVPVVWLARTLVRHALTRQPVLRLDSRGISGAALQPPVPWSVLEDVTLERGGILRLHRTPDADHPDKTRLWDGRNPARPRLSLHLLNPRQQDIAFDAIHARLDLLRFRAGSGESASRREAKIEAAFEERLDALTPTPWGLYAVVAANVLTWGMNLASGLSPTRPLSPQLFAWGANAASAVVLDGQWWRLLTATFLHGGIVHLAFNMLGLGEAGKQLCRLLGNGQFTLVYLASALAGSAASLHYAAQASVSVGASGAVFGVLGALLATSWHYRAHVPAANRRRLWTGLGFFLTYSLLHGFSQQNVDNAAHVGGLACGALLGLVLLAPFDPLAPARRRLARATLAGTVAAAGVAYAVAATPLPLVWHAQNYAAQEMLPDIARRFERAYRRVALDSQRLQRGEIRKPAFLQNAERSILPACDAILADLAPLRVPRWDLNGRLVNLYQRICTASTQSLRLEIALLQRQPDVPADAEAQLARLSAQMDQAMRELAFAAHNANANAKGSPRGPAPKP